MATQVVPANTVQFGDLCQVLEQIAKKKLKPDKEKCLNNFINDFKLKAASVVEEKDSTFFPILRLLVPSLDRERSAYNLKESKLGALLVKVLSINKDSNDGRKLLNFRSVSTTQEGDFASVAYFVFKNRMSQTSSKLNIGDINIILDEIASLEAGNKGQKLDELFSHVTRSLTAIHLKWFLRMIIKDLKLSMGTTRILSCFHPDAPDHYNVCGKLSKVCEELEDGVARPLEMGVQMFFAISPMLSERLDIIDVSQLPAGGKTYQIEEKFDGERFQVHMENGVFEYFSRKGHSFTSNYGRTFDSDGQLTPHLKDCFSAAVTSFILDGEMMGWHKANQCLGSKGMAFDVKKITDKSRYQPCFCAFDVLYYNGRSLVGPPDKGGLPLKERLKLLDNIFTEVPGSILHSKRDIVKQNSDILNALNKAIDSQDEGIVVKDTESYYIANKRNAGWYKIKPEYTKGATEDLDLVIIGADEAENKRQGRAKSFLVACADSVGAEAPHRWLCIGRVATGLSYDERERVCAYLEKNWVLSRNRAPPSSLVLNKIKPDFWILPENSIVLQMRATELIRSTDFATSHTLRFPRVIKIREDKPVKDILSLDEFDRLVGNKNSVIKMATKRINEDQLGEAASKTRKKRPANVLQVAAGFKKVNLDDVHVISNALKDRKIYVLSDDEDCNKEELVRIIHSHNGKHVANIGPDTWCSVVGRLTFHARVVIDSQEADVTTTAWLRNLPTSNGPCTIAPLDMVAIKRDTRINFAREYDMFGDSYTEEIDEDTLRRCFQKMDDEPQIHLTRYEMLKLDNELFNGCNPYSFLRPCSIHVQNCNNLLAIQAKMCGAMLCDAEAASHIVLAENANVDVEITRNAILVSEKWLEKCISEQKMIDETEFLL